MLKPNVINVIAFFFIKYVTFYIFLMLLNQNYSFIRIDQLRTGQDVFYYLFLFLFLPVVMTVLLILPVYLSFKIKNIFGFSTVFLIVLALECVIYTWSTSQRITLYSFYNLMVSLIVFCVFFYKAIILKMAKR
jgi:hypothetical protein